MGLFLSLIKTMNLVVKMDILTKMDHFMVVKTSDKEKHIAHLFYQGDSEITWDY